MYYFHYPPGGVSPGCNESFGTFGMFTVDTNYQIQKPTSQFFASQLITQEWAQPGNGVHRLFRAGSDVVDPAGHVLVTAYAVLRPDGQWSVMVINKDQQNAHTVRMVFNDSSSGDHFFSGSADFITFGNAQYQWHPKARDGYPDPAGPAARSTVAARADTAFEFICVGEPARVRRHGLAAPRERDLVVLVPELDALDGCAAEQVDPGLEGLRPRKFSNRPRSSW